MEIWEVIKDADWVLTANNLKQQRLNRTEAGRRRHICRGERGFGNRRRIYIGAGIGRRWCGRIF